MGTDADTLTDDEFWEHLDDTEGDGSRGASSLAERLTTGKNRAERPANGPSDEDTKEDDEPGDQLSLNLPEPQEPENPRAGKQSAQDQPDKPAKADKLRATPDLEADLARAREQLEKQTKKQRDAHAQLGTQLKQNKDLTDRIVALEQKLADREKAAQTARPQEGPMPEDVAEDVAKAAADPESWREWQENYPEWAKPINDLLTARMATVKGQGPSVDPATLREQIRNEVLADVRNEQEQERARSYQESVDQAYQRTIQAVEQAHPGWKQLQATPDFRQWRDSQPPEIRVLAESYEAVDAIEMLNLYKRDKGITGKTSDQLRQEREQRLQRSALPDTRTASGARVVIEEADMTDKQYWDFLDQQERRRKKTAA